MILTPAELTGTDKHPWRLNADSSTVGGMQDLDFFGGRSIK